MFQVINQQEKFNSLFIKQEMSFITFSKIQGQMSHRKKEHIFSKHKYSIQLNIQTSIMKISECKEMESPNAQSSTYAFRGNQKIKLIDLTMMNDYSKEQKKQKDQKNIYTLQIVNQKQRQRQSVLEKKQQNTLSEKIGVILITIQKKQLEQIALCKSNSKTQQNMLKIKNPPIIKEMSVVSFKKKQSKVRYLFMKEININIISKMQVNNIHQSNNIYLIIGFAFLTGENQAINSSRNDSLSKYLFKDSLKNMSKKNLQHIDGEVVKEIKLFLLQYWRWKPEQINFQFKKFLIRFETVISKTSPVYYEWFKLSANKYEYFDDFEVIRRIDLVEYQRRMEKVYKKYKKQDVY